MAFTYTAGEQVWDPETHTYTSGEGSWSCDTDANKITIANHSNVKINVVCEFTDNTGNGIKGGFYRADGSLDGIENYADIALTSAAEEGWINTPNAPTANRYFKITSGAISETSNTLGTITLKIKKITN